MICNIKSCSHSICGVCNNMNDFDCDYKDYRAIGTAEECRAAVEKQIPKKPILKKGMCYAIAKDGTKEYEIIPECPNCHSIALKHSYPCRCGQILDW